MASESLQRLHVDYCGPFLRNYCALVVVDAFSKWPEVVIAKHATADFKLKAPRKTLRSEGIPAVVCVVV